MANKAVDGIKKVTKPVTDVGKEVINGVGNVAKETINTGQLYAYKKTGPLLRSCKRVFLRENYTKAAVIIAIL